MICGEGLVCMMCSRDETLGICFSFRSGVVLTHKKLQEPPCS